MGLRNPGQALRVIETALHGYYNTGINTYIAPDMLAFHALFETLDLSNTDPTTSEDPHTRAVVVNEWIHAQ